MKTWIIDIAVCFGLAVLTVIFLSLHVSLSGLLLLLTVAAWMTVGLWASRSVRKAQKGR